jgi:hypothetical protein
VAATRGEASQVIPLVWTAALKHLAAVEVAHLDDQLGRRAGLLLAASGVADVIDAAVICLAADGDDVLTSDPDDLMDLAQAAGVHVELIPV